MPSFDIVSEADMHEVTNAVDQAHREISTRFDFRGSKANYQLVAREVTLLADNDFMLQQMLEILRAKLAKRKIDIQYLEIQDPTVNLSEAKQKVTIRQGIDAETAKKITQAIKAEGLKVTAARQEDQVRVTGKNRDDLQTTMKILREKNFGLPLQFNNFRD